MADIIGSVFSPLGLITLVLVFSFVFGLYMTLFSRRVVRRMPSGQVIPDPPNPLMQLFQPIFSRSSGYKTPEGAAQMRLKLHHAGDWFGGSLDRWYFYRSVMPIMLGGIFFGLFAMAGMGPTISLVAGVIGGMVGVFYPPAQLKSRIKARSGAVLRDVPVFIETLSVYVTAGMTLPQAISEIDKISRAYQIANLPAERLTPDQLARLRTGRATSAFRGPLWREVSTLALAGGNLVRRGPETPDMAPDPLQQFALNANNRELEEFVIELREALRSQLSIPEMAGQIRRRAQQIRNEYRFRIKEQLPKQQQKAIGFLVMFNMPLLWAVTLGPAVYMFLSS